MLTPEKEGDEERLIDELDEVIQGSIKQHMVSDVEVGSFLSGGVDSSLIAACFTGDRSFTCLLYTSICIPWMVNIPAERGAISQPVSFTQPYFSSRLLG